MPFLTGPIGGNSVDLCETSFFIAEWIALKLKILPDIKIRFKKKQTFSQSDQLFLLHKIDYK
jgi:hypothetical protein